MRAAAGRDLRQAPVACAEGRGATDRGALPTIWGTAALRSIQQLAGNRAVATALLALQRDAPLQTAAAPGRIPDAQEQERWDDPFPEDATFRILVEPTYGYNCFAWAVGDTSRDVTSDTIFFAGGYASTLDGWTKYLIERQGFGRFADGLDASADLILYGTSATRVQHAARKAGAVVWVAHVHQQTGRAEQVSGDLARPGGHERWPLRSGAPLFLARSVRMEPAPAPLKTP